MPSTMIKFECGRGKYKRLYLCSLQYSGSNCGLSELNNLYLREGMPSAKQKEADFGKILEQISSGILPTYGNDWDTHVRKGMLILSDYRKRASRVCFNQLINYMEEHPDKWKGVITDWVENPNSHNFIRAAVVLTTAAEDMCDDEGEDDEY